MHTARSSCSAAVHTEWLVVAGGYDGGALSSVEVLNTDTKQWYAGPPLQVPSYQMMTATVGDMFYSMGGIDKDDKATDKVYSVSIPTLIRHINSKPSSKREPKELIWKEITGLQLTKSSPLCIRGSLLAVGGRDKDRKEVTAIHLYHPDTEEWVKVGDLPTPRSLCTCTRITDREVLVAGGYNHIQMERMERIDIALLN